MKESYTQVEYLTIFTIAFHIEVTPLADGTYEFIQDSDGNFSEAQANIVELVKYGERPYPDWVAWFLFICRYYVQEIKSKSSMVTCSYQHRIRFYT